MPEVLEDIPDACRGKAPRREVRQVTAPDPRVGETLEGWMDQNIPYWRAKQAREQKDKQMDQTPAAPIEQVFIEIEGDHPDDTCTGDQVCAECWTLGDTQ